MALLHQQITASILESFYSVVKALPYGLDKTAYIIALTADLKQKEFNVLTNQENNILFNNNIVGQIALDIIVDSAVLIKVDTGFDFITRQQEQAAMALLKVSNYEVLLLLNFGLEADFKRLFLSNDFKKTDMTDKTEGTIT